jgi:hypothetical protein
LSKLVQYTRDFFAWFSWEPDPTSSSFVISIMTHSSSCRTRTRCMVSSTANLTSELHSSPSTGFTVSLYEYEATIPGLWKAVKGQDKLQCGQWREKWWTVLQNLPARTLNSSPRIMLWVSFLMTVARPIIVAIVSLTFVIYSLTLVFLSGIVWSNFEIGNLDLWRGEAYTKFFDFLDEKGGFYYEVCFSSSLSYSSFTLWSSVGEMHPYTALELRFLQGKIKLYVST